MNELRITHPEVKTLLQNLNNYSRASVSFSKQSQSLEILQNLVIEGLKKGKRIAIVSSDATARQNIERDLNHIGFLNLVINLCKNEGILYADDLNFTRILRDHVTKSIDINYLNHIKRLTDNHLNSLLHAFESMDKEVIEDLTWQALVDYKALLERECWTTVLDKEVDDLKFKWNLDELMEMRKDLQYKVNNFRMHYTSLKEVDPFTDAFYQGVKEEKEIDDRITYCYDLIEQLKNVQLQIKNLAERERTMALADSSVTFNQVKQACNELFRLKSLVNYLEAKQKVNPLKTGLLGFEKDPIEKELLIIKEEIKTQIELIKNNTNINTLNMSNYQSIDIAGIKNQLEDIFVFDQPEEEQLVFNIDDQVNEIRNLYFGINSKEWLKKSFHINKQHHDNVIHDINRTIVELQRAVNFIVNNNDYIIWSIDATTQSDRAQALQEVINPLMQTDSEEWCDIFENWYLMKILNQNFSQQFVEAFDYESFVNQLKEEQQIELEYIQHYWKQQKIWADTTFEEDQTNIRRMLHSQINRLNGDIALSSWGKLISTYFPITIIDEKKIVNNLDLLNTWDYIFVVDGTKLIKAIGDSKIGMGKKLIAIQSISNHAYKQTDFSMNAESYHFTNSSSDKKLESSRVFSKELLKYGLPTKVYQNHDSIYISFWTASKNGLFERIVGNVKEVNLGDNPTEMLQDFFVDNHKSVNFLIQDGLFNLQHKEKLNQIEFIELLKINGFKFRNLWTKDFYLVGKDLISSLLADIANEIQEENKDDLQASYTTENYVAPN